MRSLSVLAVLCAVCGAATAHAQLVLPHLEAARRADCAIDVSIPMGTLPQELSGVAVLVVPHAAIATTTLDVPCAAGRVVAEVPRAVLDAAPSPDVALALTIDAQHVACGDEVGVLLCGRDRRGALREGTQNWARSVGPVGTSGRETIATPSGDVQSSSLLRGGAVLARDPSGAVVETRVRSVRDGGGKRAVEVRFDDGRTLFPAADLRFVVVGASAPRRAGDLVAGDAIPTRDGGVVHVAAAPIANGYLVTRTVTDVAWPDTYYWDGLLVADDGRAASRVPAVPPAAFAVPAEQASFHAADQSWDCQVMGTVDVRSLPPGARSVVLVAAPHPGPLGARVPLACAGGTRVASLPRAVVDAARAATGTARFAVTLSGGPISCLAHVAVLPCAEDASGALVALAPSARYAQGGPACLMEGTPIATPLGDVPVEALTPGTELESFDVATGRPTRVRVQRVARRPDARVLAIEADPGLVLRVTAEHLIWNVRAHHFVQAGSLHAGDLVRGSDGREHRIVSTGVESERAAVYDVSVDGPHAYFAWGVLVHNY